MYTQYSCCIFILNTGNTAIIILGKYLKKHVIRWVAPHGYYEITHRKSFVRCFISLNMKLIHLGSTEHFLVIFLLAIYHLKSNQNFVKKAKRLGKTSLSTKATFLLKIYFNFFFCFVQTGTTEIGGVTVTFSPVFEKGNNRRKFRFITISWVILWFIKIELKQNYYSVSRGQKGSEWFSIISVTIVITTSLLNRNKHTGIDNCVL